MSINIMLEILRWCGVGVGFYFANVGGQTPQEQFSALCIWIVLCLAGLTASRMERHQGQKLQTPQPAAAGSYRSVLDIRNPLYGLDPALAQLC